MRSYGLISVPIHELSHVVACLIFRHRIDRVVLFDFYAKNGALGCVQHSYSSRSLWQVVGNFFIGIAPIFGGILATVLCTSLLVSNGDHWITDLINLEALSPSEGSQLIMYSQFFMKCTVLNFEHLTARFSDNMIMTLVWGGLVATIGLYLTPSVEDLKGSFKGFIVLTLVLFLLQLVIHEKIDFEFIERSSVVLSSILSLALTASVCLLLVTRLLLGVYSAATDK